MYKITEFKADSVDMKEIGTYLNTSENMKEVTKEGLWRNNHHAAITKDSDFTLHRVNNEEIVSENGIKIQSFSNASEILDMTGNYFYSISRKIVHCLCLLYNNKRYPRSKVE